MHLLKPEKGRRKWQIRFANWDDRIVKVMGEDTKTATMRLSMRLELLLEDKRNGDPPRHELRHWIKSLSPKRAKRLATLDLIDMRMHEVARKITKHLDEYEKAVKSRRGNTEDHAANMKRYCRRAFEGLNIKSYDDITAHDFVVWLGEQGYTPATQRHYITAMQDFCKWMCRTKRARKNPVTEIPKPAPVPSFDRRPYEIDEIRQLFKALEGLEFYSNQSNHSKWTGYDRKMIYWTAVKTALRLSDLRSLRISSLHLDSFPAFVRVKARDTKNKTDWDIPIPSDLAKALKDYTKGRKPSSKLFWIPKGNGPVEMLRRDLRRAFLGFLQDLGDDVKVDFHTLRATAITWWLQHDKLTELDVQRLGRFKTLAMVQKYTRGFKMQQFGWLDQGVKLEGVEEEAKPQVSEYKLAGA